MAPGQGARTATIRTTLHLHLCHSPQVRDEIVGVLEMDADSRRRAFDQNDIRWQRSLPTWPPWPSRTPNCMRNCSQSQEMQRTLRARSPIARPNCGTRPATGDRCPGQPPDHGPSWRSTACCPGVELIHERSTTSVSSFSWTTDPAPRATRRQRAAGGVGARGCPDNRRAKPQFGAVRTTSVLSMTLPANRCSSAGVVARTAPSCDPPARRQRHRHPRRAKRPSGAFRRRSARHQSLGDQIASYRKRAPVRS